MIDFDPPPVFSISAVGTHPAVACAGGGYVWDEVLEYRVWLHPEQGADDLHNGNDYFLSFSSYRDALDFSELGAGREEPLALVLQREYLEESAPGNYTHVIAERITEWPIEFLRRPRRTPQTIPAFLAPDAPSNRLEILRGLV